MRRLIFICLSAAMFFCAAPVRAQEESAVPVMDEIVPGTDVRGFIWGVPSEDVIKYERVVLFERHDNQLLFIDKINGVKTLISYEFYNNKLWRVTFDSLKDDYSNPQDLIDNFVRMSILLNKQYGEAIDKKEIWANDYYKNKHNRWGLAVLNDYLKLQMKWQTSRTDVVMSLEHSDVQGRTYKFRVVHTGRAIAAAMEQDTVNQVMSPESAPLAP